MESKELTKQENVTTRMQAAQQLINELSIVLYKIQMDGHEALYSMKDLSGTENSNWSRNLALVESAFYSVDDARKTMQKIIY